MTEQELIRNTAAADGGPARRLAAALAGSREFDSLIAVGAPAVLSAWAGTSLFRRAVAGVIAKILTWGFAGRSGHSGRTINEICADPAVVRDLAEISPHIAGGVLGVMESFLAGMESLPADDRQALVAACLERSRPGGTLGRQLTAILRMLNSLHQADPLFFTKRITPHLREWIVATDFGELKECVDSSSADMVALLGAINEELWRYPAKVVCLMSIAPALLNTALDAARASLAPLNRLAPDLLADVFLSLVREADGARLGALIAEAAEVLRKLYTGSELIGEQGRPRLPEDVARFAGEVIEAVDLEALIKVRTMTTEVLEQAGGRLMDILEERPELFRALITERFERLGRRVRMFARGMDSMEKALSDAELADMLARGLTEIGSQDLALASGRFLEILNRVHDLRPGLLPDFLTQLTGAMDARGLGETVGWFMEGLGRAIEPIAPEVVPPLLKAAAGIIAAAGEGEAMRDARSALWKALRGEESE